MKRKRIVFGLLVVVFLILSPRLGVLAMSAIRFDNTRDICQGEGPVPILLDQINTFSVTTDRGTMFPGDDYDVPGEGYWLGNATLVYVANHNAAFLLLYPAENTKERAYCRWYVNSDHIFRK